MLRADPLVVHLPPSLDAWTAFRKLAHLPYVLFLDSASSHTVLGRYSFIAANPFSMEVSSGASAIQAAWDRLKLDAAQWRMAHDEKLPPFQGGLAGMWGYGVGRAFENIPLPGSQEFDVPDMVLGWYDWVVAFDHFKQESFLISTGIPASDRREQLDRAEARADEVLSLLCETSPSGIEPVEKDRDVRVHLAQQTLHAICPSLVGDFGNIQSNFTPEAFKQAIQRAIDYTHAGDCFQVNLAQRLIAPFEDDPIGLYQRLRERNAAQFAGFFRLGRFVVASASPERFVQINAQGVVETRPIKGTRPRGGTAESDTVFAQELLHSSKDRAENIMIVDLMRNDLGRVAEFGSIQVPTLCGLESNAAVHHLVSVVQARVRPDKHPLDVLAATFPGGSVTGAPKVRAMEIIAELEPTARGPYCGCLGYISFSGVMDTNILIRTFTLGGGWAQFPVGGGIVADSEPEEEYAETLHKAQGLLVAIQ